MGPDKSGREPEADLSETVITLARPLSGAGAVESAPEAAPGSLGEEDKLGWPGWQAGITTGGAGAAESVPEAAPGLPSGESGPAWLPDVAAGLGGGLAWLEW